MSDYDPFAASYDAWSADMTEDVAWYVGLAQEAAEPIVELAVGSGRVSIPIAREEVNHYVPADSRIELSRGRGDETVGVLRVSWMTKSECEGLIDVAGLEVEALYGGFHREPFDDDSLELVWVARKPL